MALITHDASTSQVFTATATTQTMAHTAGTLVSGLGWAGILQSSGSTDDCTGVTANGQAMTKVTSIQIPGGVASWLSLWHIESAPSGTYNIVASFSSARSAHIHYSTFESANQIGVPLDSDTASGSTDPSDTPAMTTETNSWAICFSAADTGGTPGNLDPDGTQRSRQDSATTSRSSEISTKENLSAGTTTFSIAGTAGTNRAAIAAVFKVKATFSPKVIVI